MSLDSLNNIVQTVVREFKWSPETVSEMYIDDACFKGLKYWYDDIVFVHKQLKNK